MASPTLQSKPLSQSHVVVTGGSRDIGGGIVLELAKAGAHVMAVFRSHAERAQKIVEEIKKVGGPEPILVQADLVNPDGRETVFTSWKEKFQNDIDILVLCASGATMEINVDANAALVDKFIAIRKERIAKGEKLTAGTVVFLQSEPGHYHRVIDGVFDFLEYYRTKVGPAKRAGEDAFRKRWPALAEVNARGIVVCPPEVTDTFNMKLFELQEKAAREKSRELSAMLGTKPFVTIEEVAQTVKEQIENGEVANSSIKLFGNVTDGLTMLGRIYGEEAIYTDTYEKVAENKGVGRMIVNPSVWKRTEEPALAGEVKSKTDNEIMTAVAITKDHMRGHFREDIAAVFPGHKSMRTAAVALGRFLKEDGTEKIKLSKYKSVKFRSTVVPGNTLITTAKILPNPPLVKEGVVVGDAVQAVDGKETMDIRGMVVERMKSGEESAVLLDQLVEAAAQTVGMHVLESLQGEDVLPLFHSTGEAEFLIDVKPGDNLLIKAENARVVKSGAMNIFSADVEIMKATIENVEENGIKVSKVSKEEKVATIKSLQGLLLPREEVLKKIGK